MQVLRYRCSHVEQRREAYPDVTDQLDAIMKLAEALQEQGFVMPIEVQEWIAKCRAVKAKFPKQ